jgi:hypothetical protein
MHIFSWQHGFAQFYADALQLAFYGKLFKSLRKELFTHLQWEDEYLAAYASIVWDATYF